MFEIFVLLINEINPHSSCFVTCFPFIFTREALLHRGFLHSSSVLHIWEFPWECATRICLGYLPQKFALGICRRNLPWLFSAKICLGYLPWVFCILKRVSFCMCEQILFKWKQIFFICEQDCLICEIFFINSIPFVFAVAVMDHRTYHIYLYCRLQKGFHFLRD